VAFGTNCRSAPVPFIFLRHYCMQMRVDLFCFLDAAKFFWTTIALASYRRCWTAGPDLGESGGLLGWWRQPQKIA
jgi:hypothetical protein